MSPERIQLLGLPLTAGATQNDVLQALDDEHPRLISFINPAAYALARRFPAYKTALANMDMVLPDGMGVALACYMLTHRPATRLSFDMSSLAGPFFAHMAAKNRSLLLIGGAAGVAEKVRAKMAAAYRGIRCLGALDGFGDRAAAIQTILSAQPDVVLAGLGAGTQEEFLLQLRAAGFKGLGITCGGFFDQYAAADRYYPALVDALHLRFAYRLYKEPARLWRRYLLDYPYFIGKFIQAYVAGGRRRYS